MAEQVFEGTWEEIMRRADELAGHRVRVLVLDNELEAGHNGEDDVNPHALEEAIAALVNRTPEEVEQARARLFQEMEPPRPLPEGKTLLDVICGQWPGDETDEEVYGALKKLS